MSEDGRKIFTMETALGVLAEQQCPEVLQLLSFAMGREVTAKDAPLVLPLIKGWLITLFPDFMQAHFDGSTSFTTWASDFLKKFGDNVSLPNMESKHARPVLALLDHVASLEATAEEKETEADNLTTALATANKELEGLAALSKQKETLEQKCADMEQAAAGLKAEIAQLKESLAAFDGKVAINEKEIEKAIKDIIVKTAGSISAAGGVAAEAGAEAPAADTSADGTSAVPDDFGFGTSGADGDGFGF